MTTPPASPQTRILAKLLVPFGLSILLGGFIFYGSEAYQVMGLAALESTLIVLGYALGIAEFLVIATLVQRVVQLIILDRLIAKALGTPAPRLLSQLASFIIYSLTIAAIFGVLFKKDLTVVLATFGGFSIVVGLALKNMILDVFAGLTINLDRSINIGDCISINPGRRGSSVEGTVDEISWRTTRLLGSDGNVIIVPNNQLSSSTLINYSKPADYFQFPIVVTLDSDVPTDKALRILLTAAVEASPKFSPAGAPPPAVSIQAITLQGIDYKINVYPRFKTRSLARDWVQQRVLCHLGHSGLAPARVRQDVYDAGAFATAETRTIDLATVLGRQDIFRDLDGFSRQLLADAATRRQWPADTLLMEGGDIADTLFLVIEGLLTAREWRRKSGEASPLARPDKVLGPGTLINATAMLAGGVCDVTLRTRTPVLLYEMGWPALETLFQQRPEYAMCISRRVAEQLAGEIAEGDSRAYSRYGTDNAEALSALVFKNLQRSLAHIELTQA